MLRTQTRQLAAGVFGQTARRANVRVLPAVLLIPALLLGGCARQLADVNYLPPVHLPPVYIDYLPPIDINYLRQAEINYPPTNTNDACAIFEERKNWYYASNRAWRNWDVPVALILSFIRQESGFRSRARANGTSAYGYSQAINATWKKYQEETGAKFARRDSFSDASDFIGWYNDKSVRELGLAPQDAYSLYLAYHEGWWGYRKKSYWKKPWLIKAAKKVQQRTDTYSRQLERCDGRLKVLRYRLFSALGADQPPA